MQTSSQRCWDWDAAGRALRCQGGCRTSTLLGNLSRTAPIGVALAGPAEHVFAGLVAGGRPVATWLTC